jgi:hypothetical protein
MIYSLDKKLLNRYNNLIKIVKNENQKKLKKKKNQIWNN